MRYFNGVLLGVGILLLVAGVIFLLTRLRMYYARQKVKRMSMKEKEQRVNDALAPFGFGYDEENDGICSTMYPWQREMGYCRAYDERAFSMYMVIDCEPVYFSYNGNRYLLELWKGQYGCTTGAEIGLYVNRSKDWESPADELFYECAEDEERIYMHYVLYKNGQRIQERSGIHWWLTGFCVGMFSDKSELAMEVEIGFPNGGMCNAFCESLIRMGYDRRTLRVEQYRVSFLYDRPYSIQPTVCSGLCCRVVMRRNRKNCKLYTRVSKDFSNTLDKISYIGYCFPLLYRTLIRIGTKSNGRKLRKYQNIMLRAK